MQEFKEKIKKFKDEKEIKIKLNKYFNIEMLKIQFQLTNVYLLDLNNYNKRKVLL